MKFFLYRAVFGLIFIFVLMAVIALARGYRPNITERKLESTGILVASSSPDGAKVYVNGKLEGATNSNVIVKPGMYDIEIKKDGYTPWKKRLSIKGELVIKTDALLLPQNPSLSPVTSLGVIKALTSPSGDKVIILSDSGDVEKDGIYLLENNRNPLSIINPLKILILKTHLPQNINLNSVEVEFSPDEKEMLITVEGIDSQSLSRVYLISSEEKTLKPIDVTASVDTIRLAWEKENQKILSRSLATLKKPLNKIAPDIFDVVTFSPNEEKILYRAVKDFEIPLVIKPRLIARNQSPEMRSIQKGNLYMYDSKEDMNFEIKNTESPLWYPDSSHLVIQGKDNISIMDYDGTNSRVVYSGPFEKKFVEVTKDGKLFILLNLNSQKGTLPDLYSVGIR
ncbi:hypothetical protein A2957_00285 [Candidatus Roizmanbacteria bacterium RIFCSPLOWO2_01_FULL_38_11]|uniref:PEGA domain-containing protein n=1 Tax=Candidatus Roizmanbacteria bacterium RIFCSPLOWO2_01_FULL_38_11 TaxID=1802060 RepID=A0A1F7IM52_9BACT|nr:MAG: hypothetical protein A2957_00285 [Candidatus Roizmanbacteria bacterium RIFCSPLOWO2_01_FULL_38_11]